MFSEVSVRLSTDGRGVVHPVLVGGGGHVLSRSCLGQGVGGWGGGGESCPGPVQGKGDSTLNR